MKNPKFKYILMKSKRNSAKAIEHKILGGQAQKLKEKLDTLKEEIRKKKEQKEMNKTSTSIYSKKGNSMKQKTSVSNTMQQFFQSKDSFLQVLKEIKMETMKEKLNENQIFTLQDLYNASSQQIDKWKNIPVGYRIKLKKIIEQQGQRLKSKELKTMQTKPSSQRDIQAIIESRKSKVIFLPIHRAKDEDSQEEAERPLEEAQETSMIQSILHAFRPKQRLSCFRNNKLPISKHVHWSHEVQEMQRINLHHKTYPKQKIQKDVFHVPEIQLSSKQDLQQSFTKVKKSQSSIAEENKGFPDYKYCWICLKIIKNCVYSLETRHFCSSKCLQKFQVSLNNWQKIQTEQKERVMEQKESGEQEGEIDLDVI